MNNVNPLYYLTEIEKKQLAHAAGSVYTTLRRNGVPKETARQHIGQRLSTFAAKQKDRTSKIVDRADDELLRIANGGKVTKLTKHKINAPKLLDKNSKMVRDMISTAYYHR